MKIILKNGRLVSHANVLEEDLYIQDGQIVTSNTFLEKEADRVVDCSGKVILPGVIDVHVHFREPGASHKETWESASRAAAMGGVTTVLDMPNTNPATTTREILEAKRRLVKGRSLVNYGFHFGGTKDVSELREVQNVPGIKVYMGSSTGDLLVDDPKAWEAIFQVSKERKIPVIVHAENETRIKERTKELQGQSDPKVHTQIRDCQCAVIATEEAISLRKKIGNKLHIAHVSCAEELEILEANPSDSLTCEVTPHHLYFTANDMKDAALKMNPPLRTEGDVRALWEGVRKGTVSMVATDHAPHTKEEKSKPILEAPAGVPGVEFLLPLLLNEVNQNLLELTDLPRLLTFHPAQTFGLLNKGYLSLGNDADLVVVDMELEKTITEDMVESLCGWTPYLGYKIKGWPVMTMVGGEIVMEERGFTGVLAGREILTYEFAKVLLLEYFKREMKGDSLYVLLDHRLELNGYKIKSDDYYRMTMDLRDEGKVEFLEFQDNYNDPDPRVAYGSYSSVKLRLLSE